MLCQEGVETFKAFCGPAGPEMGMKSFAKLCRDCGFIDQTLTSVDADLIFAKVVPKGQRRMTLQKFEDALRLVAERKGMDTCQVCRAVENSGGPIMRSTKADAVRFHDDRSTYTGTHAHGGPRTGPKGTGSSTNQVWLSTLRPARYALEHEEELQDMGPESPSRPSVSNSRDGSGVVQAVCLWEASIEEVFQAYCGGQPSMDGKSFVKLCKDAQLHDRALTPNDLDLIFTKVVLKGQRRIDVRCFQHALWHIAEKKGIKVETVRSHIAVLGSNGPILNGTKAETVRFHDDKSTYTGTHIHGGPDVGPTLKASNSEVWQSQLRPVAKCEVKRRDSSKTRDAVDSGKAREESPQQRCRSVSAQWETLPVVEAWPVPDDQPQSASWSEVSAQRPHVSVAASPQQVGRVPVHPFHSNSTQHVAPAHCSQPCRAPSPQLRNRETLECHASAPQPALREISLQGLGTVGCIRPVQIGVVVPTPSRSVVPAQQAKGASVDVAAESPLLDRRTQLRVKLGLSAMDCIAPTLQGLQTVLPGGRVAVVHPVADCTLGGSLRGPYSKMKTVPFGGSLRGPLD